MKGSIKKSITFILTALMVCMMAMPAFAAIEYDKEQLVYLDNSSNWQSIYIYGLPKNQSLKKSSVKTSNSKIVKFDYITNSSSTSSRKTEYFEKGRKAESSKNSDASASIDYSIKKAGKATISFKIGNKTYKTKVTALKYTNPLKSLTITGVKKGKNLAGEFKKSNLASAKVSKNVSKAVVTAKAAKGWGISDIEVEDNDKNVEREMSASGYWDDKTSKFVQNYLSNATVYGTDLKKGAKYQVNITLFNKKNGGRIFLYYNLD